VRLPEDTNTAAALPAPLLTPQRSPGGLRGFAAGAGRFVFGLVVH
jgi:hypothetical protein